jgi:predicted dehydrogenase
MCVGDERVRVDIIGCCEIVQVAHIPTLNHLSDLFKITYLCDTSENALSYCPMKVVEDRPAIPRRPEELCSSLEVDVVLIANSYAYHAVDAILGLETDEARMRLSMPNAGPGAS